MSAPETETALDRVAQKVKRTLATHTRLDSSVKDLYKVFDPTRRGVISHDDFAQSLIKAGAGVAPQQARDLAAEMDKEKSGTINYSTIMDALEEVEQSVEAKNDAAMKSRKAEITSRVSFGDIHSLEEKMKGRQAISKVIDLTESYAALEPKSDDLRGRPAGVRSFAINDPRHYEEAPTRYVGRRFNCRKDSKETPFHVGLPVEVMHSFKQQAQKPPSLKTQAMIDYMAKPTFTASKYAVKESNKSEDATSNLHNALLRYKEIAETQEAGLVPPKTLVAKASPTSKKTQRRIKSSSPAVSSREAIAKKHPGDALHISKNTIMRQVPCNLGGLRKLFYAKDVSGSGYVNYDEFKSTMLQAGVTIPDDRVKVVFDTHAVAAEHVPTHNASDKEIGMSKKVHSLRNVGHSHTMRKRVTPLGKSVYAHVLAEDKKKDAQSNDGDSEVISAKSGPSGMSVGGNKLLNIDNFIENLTAHSASQAFAKPLSAREREMPRVPAYTHAPNQYHNLYNLHDLPPNLSEKTQEKSAQAVRENGRGRTDEATFSGLEKRRVLKKVLHAMSKQSDPLLVFKSMQPHNGSGMKVSPEEFRKGLLHCGVNLNDHEFSVLNAHIGTNGDGKVEAKEIFDMMHTKITNTDTLSADAKRSDLHSHPRYSNSYRTSQALHGHNIAEYTEHQESKSLRQENLAMAKVKGYIQQNGEAVLKAFTDPVHAKGVDHRGEGWRHGFSENRKVKPLRDSEQSGEGHYSLSVDAIQRRLRKFGVPMGVSDASRLKTLLESQHQKAKPLGEYLETGAATDAVETKLSLQQFCDAVGLGVATDSKDHIVELVDPRAKNEDCLVFASSEKSHLSQSSMATTMHLSEAKLENITGSSKQHAAYTPPYVDSETFWKFEHVRKTPDIMPVMYSLRGNTLNMKLGELRTLNPPLEFRGKKPSPIGVWNQSSVVTDDIGLKSQASSEFERSLRKQVDIRGALHTRTLNRTNLRLAKRAHSAPPRSISSDLDGFHANSAYDLTSPAKSFISLSSGATGLTTKEASSDYGSPFDIRGSPQGQGLRRSSSGSSLGAYLKTAPDPGQGAPTSTTSPAKVKKFYSIRRMNPHSPSNQLRSQIVMG